MFHSKARLVAGALFLGGLIGGPVACESLESDQQKADQRVKAAVSKSLETRRRPTTQNLAAAASALTKAVAEPASLPEKIQARNLLAMSELESADPFIIQRNRAQAELDSALWEIARTSAQIRSITQIMTSLSGNNPEPTLKAIAEKKAAAVAASEAAGAKAAKIQEQISAIGQQVQQLTSQRDALAAEATQLAEQAGGKKAGKEADDLAGKAADKKFEAAKIGHTMDQVSAKLLPLQKDLAAAQADQKTAQATAAAMDQAAARTTSNWEAMQQQIGQQKAQATVLGEALTRQAQQLLALEKKAAAAQGQAATLLEKSAKDYAATADDARKNAGELGKSIKDEKFANAPEKKAWESLLVLQSPASYKLREGQAQHALGTLSAQEAGYWSARDALSKSLSADLEAAGLSMPQGLTGTGEQQAKAQQAADGAYAAAAKIFLDVYEVGASPKNVKEAARFSRMFSLLGQYHLTGAAEKKEEAKKEFNEIFGERKDDPLAKAMPADLRS